MSFKELGLRPELLTQVEKQGYTTPTPIQEKAIPIIIRGGDILAGAQTGTGKTAAFTLPLLHRLSTCGNGSGRRPRALIVTPTRELAAQVGESVDTYGQGLRLNSAVIFGGVGINPQISKLRRGVDIVIGTPGRLLDLSNQRALDLSRIEILVLDEADRMLNMGFIHDIRRIIKLVPKRRQTLFFSATYSNEITTLANTILHRPDRVEVARKNTAAETVNQTVYHVSKSHKRVLLSHIITENNWHQILIFTKTKHGANRLCTQLQRDGINSAAIHGNKSQGARTRALEEFKTGKVRTLVATDIAARGIDIDQLPYVINYELPHVSEDYVHRIGRTGRAGSTGDAISLVAPDEQKLLRGIERLIKLEIPVTTLDSETEKELALKVQSAPKEHSRRPQQRNHSRRPQRQGSQHDRRKSHYRRSR